MTARRLGFFVICAALLGAACTVHQTEAPTLSGPSSTATTVSVSASPDVINLGQSTSAPGETSTIAVQVSRFDGKPVQPGSVRLDVLVPESGNASAPDCGQFSSRTLQFGTDGKTGTAKFTAPSFPIDKICPNFAPGNSVLIAATLVDSGLQSSNVPVRLIGRAPDTPTPQFSFFPASPTVGQSVQFDGRMSCAGPTASDGGCVETTASITSYEWDFGDGGRGTGAVAYHSFAVDQPYVVTLTVRNDRGSSARMQQTVTVTTGTPVPDFTITPSAAGPGTVVTVNASSTKTFGGATIQSYQWTFEGGVPSTASTQVATTQFPLARTTPYTITLTVTDSVGRIATASKTISVQ